MIGNPLLRLRPSCHLQTFGDPVRAASARANRSARSGCARQYESIASRGVGGIKGRLRARVSTAGGKISGRLLERRARARLLHSACSVCQFDMRLHFQTVRIITLKRKAFVHRTLSGVDVSCNLLFRGGPRLISKRAFPNQSWRRWSRDLRAYPNRTVYACS